MQNILGGERTRGLMKINWRDYFVSPLFYILNVQMPMPNQAFYVSGH